MTSSSSGSPSVSSSTTWQRERRAEMTSKYGFSVVAPMSVTRPSSTAGRRASCWALLKRWISSMKRIVRWPLPPRRSRAFRSTWRTSSTRAETADSSSNAAPVISATMRARVVFPTPGGPYRMSERRRSSSIARRSAEPGPRTCCWPTSSSSVRGRSRCASGARAAERSRAASAKRSVTGRSMLRTVATHEAPPNAEDYSEPVLPGTAKSDYERYLNTEELLALQKGPDEWVHRDELLFQTVHQSSELWLKLAWNDVEAATEHLRAREIAAALRLLRRSTLCLSYATTQLDMLEQMSPWEYQEIRKVLGHGSGFDSPGWREMRRVVPLLGQAFHALREEAGLSLVDVYVRGREHEELYQLAEVVTEVDERINLWRIRHYKVVARVIGDSVVGTQGTPVEVLGRLVHHVFFPELWRVRNELTALSKEE